MPDLSNANFASTSRCSFNSGSADVSLTYRQTSRGSSPVKSNTLDSSGDVDADNMIVLNDMKSEIYENNAKNEVVARLLGFKVDDCASVDIQFDEERLRIKFKTRSASFLEDNRANDRTVFIWECRLENAVDKELCSSAIRNGRIEITLKKLDSSKKWTNLAFTERRTSNVKLKAAENVQVSNDWNNNNPTTSIYLNGHKESSESKPQEGLCGIINIGNTCFMNAILQILLNTEKLRNYFLNGQFNKDLNTTNVLGHGGKLAKAFARLNEQVWTSGERVCDAAPIKESIGTKSSQFSGFGQQDSQEFLSFLLDGLHEDLNRIVCKPSTSSADIDRKPDLVNAQISWEAFLSRNDSIIVDLFYGQLRSHLICPVCEKVSVTFDPFVFLPLSFPKPKVTFKVIYWPAGSIDFVQKVNVHLPPNSSVRQMIACVARALNSPILHSRLVRCVDKKIVDIYNSRDILDHRKPGQLHLFEFADTLEKMKIIPVVQKAQPLKNGIRRCSSCDSESSSLKRCAKCYSAVYCDRQCQLKDWSSGHKSICEKIANHVVGTPFLIAVPSFKKITSAELRRLIDAQIKKWQTRLCNDVTYSNVNSEKSLNGEGDHIMESNCHEIDKFDIEFTNIVSQKIGKCLVDMNNDSNYLDLHQVTCIAILWKQNFVPVADLNNDNENDFCENTPESDTNVKSLHELLVWFSESERLQNENSWYCSSCKRHQEAEKTMELWKLPPILIIHLKRFRYGSSLLFRNKIETPVDFPDELDMKPYLNSQSADTVTTYDLYGAVCHSGSTFFGHYISYGRLLNEKNEEIIGWRRFDDSNVIKCSTRDVHADSVYLLFYKRRNFKQEQE